jgi:hypothetical protein
LNRRYHLGRGQSNSAPTVFRRDWLNRSSCDPSLQLSARQTDRPPDSYNWQLAAPDQLEELCAANAEGLAASSGFNSIVSVIPPPPYQYAQEAVTCNLFPFRLRLLILSFRGTLEALQGIVYAGSDCFRAKCFEKPTPPAWWKDEVSAILDAAGGRIDGIAGDVWFLLQSQWKKACRPSWCLSGLTSSTLKMKRQVRPNAFPAK